MLVVVVAVAALVVMVGAVVVVVGMLLPLSRLLRQKMVAMPMPMATVMLHQLLPCTRTDPV
jgi:uncharacterized membrane protein